MENLSFVKELQESLTNKNTKRELLETLKNELNLLAEVIAQEEVDIIKAKIKSKAIAGTYEKVKGKKTIIHDHKLSFFRYDSRNLGLKKVISKIISRNIKTDGLCQIFSDYSYYPSIYWSSKVSRRLTISQMISIPLTLGLSGLSCLFGDPSDDSFSGPRVYRGKIKLDYLAKKTCNLIKNQLKNEGVTLDKIIISYPKYQWSGGFEDRIEFKDIDEEKMVCAQRTRNAKFKKGETFTHITEITLSCSIFID